VLTAGGGAGELVAQLLQRLGDLGTQRRRVDAAEPVGLVVDDHGQPGHERRDVDRHRQVDRSVGPTHLTVDDALRVGASAARLP
jgi:hypothetical protein